MHFNISSIKNAANQPGDAPEISHLISSSGLPGQGQAEHERQARNGKRRKFWSLHVKRAGTTLNKQSLANEVKWPLSAFILSSHSLSQSPQSWELTPHHWIRSHGFNSGRLCHALPTKPWISVPLWPHLATFRLSKTLPNTTHFTLVLIFCLYTVFTHLFLFNAPHTIVEVWQQQLVKSCKFCLFKGLFGMELSSIQRNFAWSTSGRNSSI